MSESNTNEWIDIKKQFRTGLFASILITMFFQFLSYEPKNNIEPIQKIGVLENKPTFKEYHSKSHNYWIELKLINDKRIYEIRSPYYNFLKHEDFINEINSGDTILISEHNNNILSLSKNGKQYWDYEKAEVNNENSNRFLSLLFFPLIIICIIVLLLKKQPFLKLNNKVYKIRFDIIVLITFLITFIVLAENIPFQFIKNGQFMK
ncbi:MAG TPA: hypothetical protein VFS71_12780 [Flavobacterium sp.]|uniref:hypothetical protein n=1 Tax=Flavobacterium sp. TaxID=239 RepID=UPI002DBD1287|nr:hypothetical protein [Flavobacterium sp.]HEU4790555.1 hypothetical protein [Flavobacterium sp.]